MKKLNQSVDTIKDVQSGHYLKSCTGSWGKDRDPKTIIWTDDPNLAVKFNSRSDNDQLVLNYIYDYFEKNNHEIEVVVLIPKWVEL